MATLLLATVLGAVLSAIIGTFWYMEKTPMGKIHMKYLGFDKLSHEEQKKLIEEMKPKMWKYYALQMALSMLTAFAVVFIVIMSTVNGLPFIVTVGFVTMNWLCFMVPVVGSALLWVNCDRKIVWKKFFYDILANLVTVIAIAGMTLLFI